MSEEPYLGTKGASMTLDSLVIVNSNVLATYKAVQDYSYDGMWHEHLCFCLIVNNKVMLFLCPFI